MDGFFAANGWKKRSFAKNGFMLTELLLAAVLGVVLLSAVLPLLTKTVSYEQKQVMMEEVFRQGIIVDESFYYTLRYSRIISVSPSEIQFYDSSNVRTGFMVKNKVVYRILSNQTKQPLTGTRYNVLVRGQVLAEPYGDNPYFRQDGKRIHIAVVLKDQATGVQYPCLTTVVPWSWEQENNEM